MPLVRKLKDKNRTEQQREQAFDAVSIFYRIEKKKTDQNSTPVLNTKNENTSTKNISEPRAASGGVSLFNRQFRFIRIRIDLAIIIENLFRDW